MSKTAVEEARQRVGDSVREYIKQLVLAALRRIFGIKESPMPSAPLDPEDEKKQPQTPQATMEEPKKAPKPKAKRKNDKLLIVENAYPVRENSNTKRTITDTGDGHYRVNYKSRGTGYVVETAYIRVLDNGEIVTIDHKVYDRKS